MSKDFENMSLKVRNFKCFGSEEQGFEQIKLINLIIGRNNSGKSSLLDLLEYTVSGGPRTMPERLLNKPGQLSEIIAKAPFNEIELKSVFLEGHAGGPIPGEHWSFGKQFIGTYFSWNIWENTFVSIESTLDGSRPFDNVHIPENDKGLLLNKLAMMKTNPFKNRVFRRLYAERNIQPENDSPGNYGEVKPDGGATNIIQNFINKANLPSKIVEEILLEELNDILGSSSHFTDIVCQQLDNGQWEIYLEEQRKGRIALSQSGSGLKTIILVLTFLILAPEAPTNPNRNLDKYIFAFEELENNLHPALLRRLLNYLYQKAKSTGCVFFLTTHSNVAIDMFGNNPDAQIVHVTHDGNMAKCRTIKTYVESRGILDDLDVRASDLLQSNGIIWVEGPSDRIYLNRWISLWSDGQLQESLHYQCVYYGGRLLAHLSADNPDEVEGAVAIFRVNRNAAILIDSDKRNQQTKINNTKKRILEEMSKLNGLAWVTKGREVENYLPAEVVAQLLSLEVDKVGEVEQYEDFFDYLNGISSDKGDYYRNKKPMLAEQLSPYFTKENLSSVFDLSEQIDALCTSIRKWNGLL